MKYLFLICLVIITLLLASPVIASDLTDAIFYGVIRATNTSDTSEYISGNVSISTPNLIASGVLNSSANNCAILNAAGSDTAFMPGYDTNPWSVWFSSISANSSRDATLYTNATGGKIRYFSDDEGMTTPDSATLEITDNFSISQAGLIDTSSGTSLKNLVYKPAAFGTRISYATSGNITSWICEDTWTHPTGFTDPDSKWSSETNVYDDNTSTYATSSAIDATSWGSFIHLSFASMNVSSVHLWESQVNFTLVDVDLYYNSQWTHYYQGAYNKNVWNILSGTLSYGVTSARLRFYNGAGSAYASNLHEVEILGIAAHVTATGVDISEDTVTTSANITHYWIEVDGSVQDTVALAGVSVPDTDSDWVFFQNGAMHYVEYQEITIDGVQQQYIEWENNSTFTDQSGNNHNATPTFRTTCSDSDVTASLVSFTPIRLAQTSGDTALEWGVMMVDTPDEPTTSYSENATPGIFFEPFVNTIATAAAFADSGDLHGMTAANYEALFWYNFAFTFIVGAGVLVFFFFAKNKQQALLLKCITMLAVMIFWALPGPNIYGMFVPLYFGFWCVGVLVLSKSWGW